MYCKILCCALRSQLISDLNSTIIKFYRSRYFASIRPWTRLLRFVPSFPFLFDQKVTSLISSRPADIPKTASKEATELPTSVNFLYVSAIATSDVEDVRTVLDFYRDEEDIVEAFKRNQARLREAEESRLAQLNQRQGGGSAWTGMFGRNLFGRPSSKPVS